MERFYPTPALGQGGVQRFQYPAGSGAAGSGLPVVKSTYTAAQAALSNDANETLYCSSGLIANEGAGVLVKARGRVRYTISVGTPNLTIRIAQSVGTALVSLVCPLVAATNQDLVFDLNFQFSTPTGTIGTGSTVFNSFANTLVAGGANSQIFGGSPVSPLFLSLQWSSASPNFSCQLREGMTWEVYYPQTVS